MIMVLSFPLLKCSSEMRETLNDHGCSVSLSCQYSVRGLSNSKVYVYVMHYQAVYYDS
jgi:hypothetical protein